MKTTVNNSGSSLFKNGVSEGRARARAPIRWGNSRLISLGPTVRDSPQGHVHPSEEPWEHPWEADSYLTTHLPAVHCGLPPRVSASPLNKGEGGAIKIFEVFEWKQGAYEKNLRKSHNFAYIYGASPYGWSGKWSGNTTQSQKIRLSSARAVWQQGCTEGLVTPRCVKRKPRVD